MICNIVIIFIFFIFEIISGVFLFWFFFKRYVKYWDMVWIFGFGLLFIVGFKRFIYVEIRVVIKEFFNDNMIGRGGFSDVYVGKL